MQRPGVGLLLIGSLSLGSLSGCGEGGKPSTPAATTGGAVSVPRVTVAAPERATLRRLVEQPGQIVAFESTPIQSRLSGYVKSVAVDIGDAVTRGQVLAEIDAPEAVAELEQKRALADQARADHKQAEAALAVAKAGVRSAEAKAAEERAGLRRLEADVARWQAESARTEQLARDAAVTTSLRDETRSKLEAARGALEEGQAQARSADAALEEARARVEKANADVVSAVASIEVAQADIHRAEASLDFSHIRAPFEGIVTRRQVDTGHLTKSGADGDPLFVVDRTDRVTVTVAVPEVDAALVGRGDPIRIRIPALDDRIVPSQVSRVAFGLDQATRTLRAETDLDNRDRSLRPGLYVHASIVAEERPDVLALPASAIRREAGKSFCMVVESGKARRHEVSTGLTDGTRIEIRSGIQASDSVIIAGADSLTDGQPVEAVARKP